MKAIRIIIVAALALASATADKDELVPMNKDRFRGRWRNRREEWVRIQMPEKAALYILDRCKHKDVPKEISNMILDTIF